MRKWSSCRGPCLQQSSCFSVLINGLVLSRLGHFFGLKWCAVPRAVLAYENLRESAGLIHSAGWIKLLKWRTSCLELSSCFIFAINDAVYSSFLRCCVTCSDVAALAFKVNWVNRLDFISQSTEQMNWDVENYFFNKVLFLHFWLMTHSPRPPFLAAALDFASYL